MTTTKTTAAKITNINNAKLREGFTAYAKAAASKDAKGTAYANATEKMAATIADLKDMGLTPDDIRAPDNAGKNEGPQYAALENSIVATLTSAQQAAFALAPKGLPDKEAKMRRAVRKVVSSRIRRLRDALGDKVEKSEADKLRDNALTLLRFAHKHETELSGAVANFGKVFASIEALNRTLGNKIPDNI